MAHYHDVGTIDAYWTVRHGAHVASIEIGPDVLLIASRAKLREFITRLQVVLDAGAEFDDHARKPKFVDFAVGRPSKPTRPKRHVTKCAL